MGRGATRAGLGVVVGLAGFLGGGLPLDFSGSTVYAQARCEAIRDGKPVTGNADALARLLASSDPCPRDAIALRGEIKKRGGELATAFVGNRGFHNPGAGSFSLFEIVTGEMQSAGRVADGEFFFGHFIKSADSRLTLNQSPAARNLMIEVVAWDSTKGLFNFYELIGTGNTGRWDYKGDSADVLTDTESLHRRRDPGRPPIGGILRCSSCHINGGPIMKELAAPHNDWWSAERRLPLGGRQFDRQLAAIAPGFVDGNRLATSVRAGLTKLTTSPQFLTAMKRRTLQEQLRPLFCAVELNLESDPTPLDDKATSTRLPSALLVDPRLGEASLTASRADYDAALRTTGSRFPEIDRRDADHAWLGPVKATSDRMIVQALVDAKTIDDEFVADVLAVDFTNPVLSNGRCGLLKFVPNEATADWHDRFLEALAASSDAAAKELAANLTSAERSAASHRQRALQFLETCRKKLMARDFVSSALTLLAQRREEVRRNEISAGPGGQILEPGFRVVFPEPAKTPIAGRLKLSTSCEIE